MTSSNAILWIGMAMAMGMFGWGLSGVITGKISTKAYGIVDGKRTYARVVRREEEPVWFWILCSVYMTIGITSLVIIYLLLHAPAVSG